MFICLLLAGLCFMCTVCSDAKRMYPLGNRIRNCDEIVDTIRSGLKNHASSITIRFSYGSDIYDELNGVLSEWIEEALAETPQADEGDYIRYQYGGYTYNSGYSIAGDRWQYTVTIVPEYYCFLTQEEETSEEIARLLKTFRFRRSTTDYERVRTIYTYLCEHVRYDKVHRKNRYYHKCSTAYAALIQGQATCQGYCTALYRLLRESDITCRIVTGAARSDEPGQSDRTDETLHAWVIAELDGQYYHLDPTWDAGQEAYRYFLVGTEHFADHAPGAEFCTDAFAEQYTLSAADYEP